MTQCRFCLLQNSGDEERCGRCGKRLSGDITFDGLTVAGATALAPRRRSATVDTDAQAFTARPQRRTRAGVTDAAMSDGQTSLFPSELTSNVIPFDSIQRDSIQRGSMQRDLIPDDPSQRPDPPAAKPEVMRDLPPGPGAKRLHAAKQSIRRQAGDRTNSDTQGSLDLDFLPTAPQLPRTLKTTVEASIYCDAPVAAPMHRAVAAFLDIAMISIACGMFLGAFQLLGGHFQLDRFNSAVATATLILITMFYGFVFALTGRETPGQHWTELRLINFDGLPPERPARFLRSIGCWLSFSACGIGLLWSLLDEENLTWHDHMSKTFPTMREPDSSFVRERPR